MVVVVDPIWPERRLRSRGGVPVVEFSHSCTDVAASSRYWRASMSSSRLLRAAIGVALVLIGSAVWTSRFRYTPEPVLMQRLGDRLVSVEHNTITDLSAACDYSRRPEGWILFILETTLNRDATVRTFFETAEEPVGMWAEYDPGLFRLGLGLGPSSAESSTNVPIRWVQRDESAFVAIGIALDGTRVIANATDQSSQWPGAYYPDWKCNAVQLGSDTRKLSEGFSCPNCDLRLRYAVGDSNEELTNILDDLSNVQSFNTRRWFGSASSLAGIFLLLSLGSSHRSGRSQPWNRFKRG